MTTSAAVDVTKASKARPIMMFIKLSSIAVPQETLRGVDKESEQFKEVYESLKVRGQESPIMVRAILDDNGNALYPTVFDLDSGQLATTDPTGLVDGAQRLGALQLIAQEIAEGKLDRDQVNLQFIDMVRAEFVGKLDESEMLLTQISRNLTKVDTKPLEVSRQIQRICALIPGATHAKIAEKLGMHVTRLGKLLKMNFLPDEVREKIEAGEIKAANALRMTELKPETAVAVMEEIKGASVDEANKIIEQAKKADKARKENDGKDVFVLPPPHLRKQAAVVARLEQPDGLCTDTLKWVLQQDEESVSVARAQWEERVKKRVEHNILGSFKRSAISSQILTEELCKGKTFAQFIELLQATNTNSTNRGLAQEIAKRAQAALQEEVSKALAPQA